MAMTKVLSLLDDWRHVATVEVAGAPPGVAQLLDESRHARLLASGHSPNGANRFDVFVDFGIGARQAAHAASAALSLLQQSADDGVLHGYRVVNGRHWLELSSILG